MNDKLFMSSKKFIEDENLLELIFNTIFTDFDNIRLFNENDMYFKDDIVLVKKEISGEEKDYFFECTKNGYKGSFDKTYFKKFIFQSSSKRLTFSDRFTSIADNTTTFKIKKISLDNVRVLITHSVKGRLFKEDDWSFVDEQTIRLREGLYQGEYIDIEIFE